MGQKDAPKRRVRSQLRHPRHGRPAGGGRQHRERGGLLARGEPGRGLRQQTGAGAVQTLPAAELLLPAGAHQQLAGRYFLGPLFWGCEQLLGVLQSPNSGKGDASRVFEYFWGCCKAPTVAKGMQAEFSNTFRGAAKPQQWQRGCRQSFRILLGVLQSPNSGKGDAGRVFEHLWGAAKVGDSWGTKWARDAGRTSGSFKEAVFENFLGVLQSPKMGKGRRQNQRIVQRGGFRKLFGGAAKPQHGQRGCRQSFRTLLGCCKGGRFFGSAAKPQSGQGGCRQNQRIVQRGGFRNLFGGAAKPQHGQRGCRQSFRTLLGCCKGGRFFGEFCKAPKWARGMQAEPADRSKRRFSKTFWGCCKAPTWAKGMQAEFSNTFGVLQRWAFFWECCKAPKWARGMQAEPADRSKRRFSKTFWGCCKAPTWAKGMQAEFSNTFGVLQRWAFFWECCKAPKWARGMQAEPADRSKRRFSTPFWGCCKAPTWAKGMQAELSNTFGVLQRWAFFWECCKAPKWARGMQAEPADRSKRRFSKTFWGCCKAPTWAKGMQAEFSNTFGVLQRWAFFLGVLQSPKVGKGDAGRTSGSFKEAVFENFLGVLQSPNMGKGDAGRVFEHFWGAAKVGVFLGVLQSPKVGKGDAGRTSGSFKEAVFENFLGVLQSPNMGKRDAGRVFEHFWGAAKVGVFLGVLQSPKVGKGDAGRTSGSFKEAVFETFLGVLQSPNMGKGDAGRVFEHFWGAAKVGVFLGVLQSPKVGKGDAGRTSGSFKEAVFENFLGVLQSPNMGKGDAGRVFEHFWGAAKVGVFLGVLQSPKVGKGDAGRTSGSFKEAVFENFWGVLQSPNMGKGDAGRVFEHFSGAAKVGVFLGVLQSPKVGKGDAGRTSGSFKEAVFETFLGVLQSPNMGKGDAGRVFEHFWGAAKVGVFFGSAAKPQSGQGGCRQNQRIVERGGFRKLFGGAAKPQHGQRGCRQSFRTFWGAAKVGVFWECCKAPKWARGMQAEPADRSKRRFSKPFWGCCKAPTWAKGMQAEFSNTFGVLQRWAFFWECCKAPKWARGMQAEPADRSKRRFSKTFWGCCKAPTWAKGMQAEFSNTFGVLQRWAFFWECCKAPKWSRGRQNQRIVQRGGFRKLFGGAAKPQHGQRGCRQSFRTLLGCCKGGRFFWECCKAPKWARGMQAEPADR